MRVGLEACGFRSLVLAGEVAERDADVVDMRDLCAHQPLRSKLVEWARGRLTGNRGFVSRSGARIVRALTQLSRTFPFQLFEMEETFGLPKFVQEHLAVPTVVRLHGPTMLNAPMEGLDRGKDFEQHVRWEREAIGRAFAVTSPSRDTLERTRRLYGVALERAVVIPNPGPIVAALECWRRDRCEPHAILFVGRFDRLKGGDIMIDAFREMAQRDSRVELLFVGPDRGLRQDTGRLVSMRAYMEEHLPSADLRRRVHVLGARSTEQIAELRRRAAVTVVASRQENFAMTVLEAMAFGTPLVAPNTGGVTEMVLDGTTALAFRASDSEDLAIKIQTLLDHPDLASRLAQAGRAYYEARFAPPVVARQMAAYYREVLDRWKHRPAVRKWIQRCRCACPD